MTTPVAILLRPNKCQKPCANQLYGVRILWPPIQRSRSVPEPVTARSRPHKVEGYEVLSLLEQLRYTFSSVSIVFRNPIQ